VFMQSQQRHLEGGGGKSSGRIQNTGSRRKRLRILKIMAWHILHTHPSQEQRLKHALESENIIAMAPRVKESRKRIYPFLPRYVFACVNLNDGDNLAIIRRAQGFRSIVEFAGAPAIIPVYDIVLIQSRMRDGFVMLDDIRDDVSDYGFRHNDPVKVIGTGIYSGMTGLFDKRLKESDRVRILLSGTGIMSNFKHDVSVKEIAHLLPEEMK